MRLINQYNFLRWYNVAEEEVTTTSDPAKGYLRDSARCDYMPMLINGEGLSFYINTTEGLDSIITDAGSAKLKLVNAQTAQVVNANIATLQMDPFITEDGNNVFTFYASVTPSAVPPGVYFFRIGNDITNFLDSTNVFVPSGNYSTYSCLCRFRHDRYFYGVNYQNLDDFYQQFRLHLNEIDAQYENDKDVYNEVTTGKQRTYNNFKKKLRTLEAYYFDGAAHDAAEIMFDSEFIYINGKQYTTKGTYKVATNVLSKLNKGTVDLYDYDFATANRCLTPISPASDSCVAVELPEGFNPPDGVEGEPYSYSVTLTGTQPFRITDEFSPQGLHWGIVGNVLSLTGIPTLPATGIETAITIYNCSDNHSDSFSGTVDIAAAPNGTHWLPKSDVSSDAFTEVESVQITGQNDEDIVVTVTGYTNPFGGTIIFNGVTVTGIGQTFSITLDGTGLSAAIEVSLEGVDPGPGFPYGMLAKFTITSASGGDIGTPADYQISKAFS